MSFSAYITAASSSSRILSRSTVFIKPFPSETASSAIRTRTLAMTMTTITTTTTVRASTTPKSTTHFILPSSKPKPTTALPAYQNVSMELMSCPPPLVFNVYNLSSSSCMGMCCLPCPASAVFYEPFKLEAVYTITGILRAISAIACAILSGSYMVLQSRRQHPHLIVLLIAMLMVPWEGMGTIWLYKRKELLCKSVYEVATMTNSWMCGVQVSVIPVAVKREIMSSGFGPICFVGPQMSDDYFFIPMSVIACMALLLHLVTIAHMVRTKIKASIVPAACSPGSNLASSKGIANPHMPPPLSTHQRRLQTARDISLLLKQQWRPGLFALFLVGIDMVYWLFYFLEAKKLDSIGPSTQWFQQWLICLAQQTRLAVQSGLLSWTNPTPDQIKATGKIAQQVCANVSRPFIPSFAWAALTDLLPAVFGIVILIIFGSRMELWRELKDRLTGTRRRGGKHASRHGSAKYLMGEITKANMDRLRQQPPPPRPKHTISSLFTIYHRDEEEVGVEEDNTVYYKAPTSKDDYIDIIYHRQNDTHSVSCHTSQNSAPGSQTIGGAFTVLAPAAIVSIVPASKITVARGTTGGGGGGGGVITTDAATIAPSVNASIHERRDSTSSDFKAA
ncbi:hypothetical protein EDD11_008945 [Mortierella claussenii]|nr:hypothetical protein EDD11_008945 [Mortierella claussenii]